MDLLVINERIDQALAANARAERMIFRLGAGVLGLGVGSLALAFWLMSPFLLGLTLLLLGLLYWPIAEIMRLRRENICLETIPTLAYNISIDRAMEEIVRLLHSFGVDTRDTTR